MQRLGEYQQAYQSYDHAMDIQPRQSGFFSAKTNGDKPAGTKVCAMA
jgi:hypothetical protein